MKAWQPQGIEWGEEYRGTAGEALKAVLEGRMAATIDRHLGEIAARREAARDWVLQAIVAGLLTAVDLREASRKARALVPGVPAPGAATSGRAPGEGLAVDAASADESQDDDARFV